jgi:tight adherence protein B
VALIGALAALSAAGAVFFLLAYGVGAYGVRPQESRLKTLAAGRREEQMAAADRVLRRGPSNAIINRMLSASAHAGRWQLQLDRADLKVRPSEYFLLRLILAVIGVVVVASIGRSGAAFALALLAGAALYMAPAYWLRLRTARRLGAIDGQLVETITLISNALRSGFAFPQGIDAAAKRVGPPISHELGRVLMDINLGRSTEEALAALNERIGSDDLDMVITAILIQRGTGGNLVEVLDNVTATMRERERLRGDVKTLTSAQRFTAWVLSLWPLCVAAMFFAVNPGIVSLMWTTGTGVALLVAWAVLNLLGVLSLQRILSIDM